MISSHQNAPLWKLLGQRVRADRHKSIIVAAGILIGMISLARLALAIRGDYPINSYKLSLYWVDYREGFVRRGFPGHVLALTVGDDPSYTSALAAGLVVSLTGCVALVFLAARLARRAKTADTRAALFVLAAATPFSVPLIIRDLGRLDAIGVTAMVVVAFLQEVERRMFVVARAGMVLAVTVAAASEEFLWAYAVPVVAVSCMRTASTVLRGAVAALAVLTPGAAIAVWSVRSEPSGEFVRETAVRVERAGAGPSDVPDGSTAADLLAADPRQQLELFAAFDGTARVYLPILYATAFLLFSMAAWWLAGRPAAPLLGATTLWLLVVATALSFVGVDYLRWWSLGFVSFLCVLLVIAPNCRCGKTDVAPKSRIALLALAAIVVATQDIPLLPPEAGR